jgi:outer membrane biosynthesis protein TonB
MAKKTYHYLAVFAFILIAGLAKSQSRSTLEDQGYDLLNSHQYVKAYEVFDKLHSRYPKEIDYQFKLGICCLNYAEKKDRAIEIFKDMKSKYKTLEVEVYLGKAYHRNYKFNEGIATLEPLVDVLTKSTRKEDKALLDDVTLTIANCKNGNYLMQNKIFADIQNIGPPINTNELEGVPIITADESQMIYTYIGHNSMGGKLNSALQSDPVNGVFLSDILVSTRDATDTKWNKPEPMKNLNTIGYDAAIAISPSGQTLFTFMSNNTNPGDIMVSKLIGNEYSAPIALNGNINSVDYWEGSCSVSADGKFLYFASERPEGLGGRDIWVSENIDGDWGPAVNLGPNINTPYNDDAPFIHPDGITLFFSSQGHQSIGGYDIMFSIKEGNEWTKPKSMGIPLNTTEDDSYYVINSKGDKGYFSSTRTGSGGFGEQDIYMVTPGILGEKPIVALIKGTVFGDDRPVEAKIEVVKIAQKENIGPFTSNNKTGKYLMALSPGFVYRIKVTAENYESIEEDLDIETLGGYMEQSKDFYMYSPAYAAASTPPKQSGVKTTMKVEPPPPKPKETKTEPVAVNEPPKEEVKANDVKPTETPEVKETPAVAETKPAVKEEPAADPVMATNEPGNEKKPKAESSGKEKESSASNSKTSSSAPCGGSLPDLGPVKGKSLNENSTYRKLLELAGNYCASNIVFKVQVGAYRNPENFKTAALSSLGKIESDSYPDGITRFTQKQFNTLREAEAHRQTTRGSWLL